MDKRIISYLRGKKEMLYVLAALALGIILIFLSGNDKDNVAVSSPGLEERIAEACSGVEGVGECAVYVYYSDPDARSGTSKVESVLVICEGADSVEVRLRLTKMLASFFGIGTNRVQVEKMRP